MKPPNRYDLPKGHIEVGENELNCAIRELYEETGIEVSTIDLDDNFRFTTTYQIGDNRFQHKIHEKQVVIFLAWLKQDVKITLSEHTSYKWMKWHPPHRIQAKMIDPLLEELEEYFEEKDLIKIKA